MKKIEAILCNLLWTQLNSIAPFSEQTLFAAELKSTITDRRYDKWLEESLLILERENYLTYERSSGTIAVKSANTVFATGKMDSRFIWKEWNQLKESSENSENDLYLRAWVRLADETMRALPEILTGKVLATDVLFPDSSMSLVEGIYTGNPVADYFNGIVADTVATYLRARLDFGCAKQVRILEVGSGTGGTSQSVFRALKPYHKVVQEYCYTDVSQTFLTRAQAEYGQENSYLTYRVLDVEQSLPGQGIEAGKYDIVIASNVLHATRNVQYSVRNLKAALQTNGLLVLNELTGHSLLQHVTFGLLDGWWLYEDGNLRIPGGPALSSESWKMVLESEGFQSITLLTKETEDLGQQVIVAESNGVVRQRRQGNESAAKSERDHVQGTSSLHPEGSESEQRLRDYVRETVLGKLAEFLKMQVQLINLEDSFSDYGLDSIAAVHFVKVLNETLRIDLKTVDIFDYSSVEKLVSYIVSAFGTSITDVRKTLVETMDSKFHPLPVIQVRDIQGFKSNTTRFVSDTPMIRHTPPSAPVTREVVPFIKGPIAIIGMSGRFAKSRNLDELWEHLANGDDLVEPVTRWDLSKYYSNSSDSDEDYCNYGSFLDDIDAFDARFFNVSGLEATYMDPQQRIFLEEAFHALEDAGYAGDSVEEQQCGVYVGCHTGDYHALFDDAPAQSMWGRTSSVIPARISYYLNLQGPAIAIDTACSSSLVAIHLACQGLWTGEIEMALAGGVFVRVTPEFYLTANRAGMLSHKGRCFAFDERADGFVFGEGAGAVVLKRLEDALADGDYIHGVIRATGINQDGKTNGITAPSRNSQKRLEREVYETFQINPARIQMVEAHGTGTQLGDPIEHEALTEVFREYTDQTKYCALGSIKTNLGHTATAAGVAGLIKVLLSLRHRKIPPSLQYKSGNPNIEFDRSPFFINMNLRDWEVPGNEKRRAALSSFGFSGTNAHMVIEEAPRSNLRHPEKEGYLIALSAHTFEQLQKQVEQLVSYCDRETHVDLGNLSFTLLTGRRHLNYRLACVVKEQRELLGRLKGWLVNGRLEQIYVSDGREAYPELASLNRYVRECMDFCRRTNQGTEYLENLSFLAHLYAQGYNLALADLFCKEHLDNERDLGASGGGYARVPLPTYPFAKERYWVPDVENKTTIRDSAVSLAKPVFRLATKGAGGSAITGIRDDELSLWHRVWKEELVPEVQDIAWAGPRHLIVLCEPGEVCPEPIKASLNGARWVVLQSGAQDVAERFETYAVQTFVEIQKLLRSQVKGPVWVQIVKPVYGEQQQLFSGLSGLLKTAMREHPRLFGQWIEVEPDMLHNVDAIVQRLKENSFVSAQEIRYKDGMRWVVDWRKVHTCPSRLNAPWRDKGIYLITGGGGALGLIFAQDIVQNAPNATLILIGRSPLVDQNTMRTLTASGARVEYRQVDVRNEQEVEDLVQSIQAEFGALHGILHCAGVKLDNFLLTKMQDDWHEVLGPKVKGLYNLDRACSDVQLDWFILCSSWAAVKGNPGQGDYATANAFMDAYAAYRNGLTRCGQRHGQTLSVNWPLWNDGGMQVDEETLKRLNKSLGMRTLETEQGIVALYRALARGIDQVLVSTASDLQLLFPKESVLSSSVQPRSNEPRVETSRADEGRRDAMLAKIQQELLQEVSQLLKLDLAVLEAGVELVDYGFDSILLTALANRLNERYDLDLSPAIFFEHSTLARVAQYFVEEHLLSDREVSE